MSEPFYLTPDRWESLGPDGRRSGGWRETRLASGRVTYRSPGRTCLLLMRVRGADNNFSSLSPLCLIRGGSVALTPQWLPAIVYVDFIGMTGLFLLYANQLNDTKAVSMWWLNTDLERIVRLDMVGCCFYTCGLVFRFVVACEHCKEITTPSTSPSF